MAESEWLILKRDLDLDSIVLFELYMYVVVDSKQVMSLSVLGF